MPSRSPKALRFEPSPASRSTGAGDVLYGRQVEIGLSVPARFTSTFAQIYLDARWADLEVTCDADDCDTSEFRRCDLCSDRKTCARLLAGLALVDGNSLRGGPMALLVNPIR